ncbi:Di-sulfide bridge nucleocytoplasmic transport domain-containing protein [Phlyctochytrium arcticum]|nr:Di-sulfide bridge nucleocytoplasmic transport domain-containing protein [Phlyctochytrium arcticum]
MDFERTPLQLQDTPWLRAVSAAAERSNSPTHPPSKPHQPPQRRTFNDLNCLLRAALPFTFSSSSTPPSTSLTVSRSQSKDDSAIADHNPARSNSHQSPPSRTSNTHNTNESDEDVPAFSFTFSPPTPSKSLAVIHSHESGPVAHSPPRSHSHNRRRSPKTMTSRSSNNLYASESDEDVPVKGNVRKRAKKTLPDHFGGRRSDFDVSGQERRGRNEGFSPRTLLLPYMISGYIQMIFYVTMIGIMLYMVGQFIMTVHHDLEMKAEEYSAEITQQITECSFDYINNKCDPATRVQYMQKACQEWELCMRRDPKEVGRYLRPPQLNMLKLD